MGTSNSSQVILLDFGLTKRLNRKLRLAFSKMVVSACMLDFSMLLDAHEEMGLKLNREDSKDMIGVLFFFKDTAPIDESKAGMVCLYIYIYMCVISCVCFLDIYQ